LRSDVDKIREVETQLKQLDRGYEVVQARHQELLKRMEDLQAKKRLDPITDSVLFQRFELPFAEADPVGPNRPMLLALVLAVALGAATALAFGLNQVNPVYFSRAALRKASFPVLGSISMILTHEALVRRRMETLGWATCVVLLLASTAGFVVFARVAAPFLWGLLLGAET
jgi:hypothetical protein